MILSESFIIEDCWNYNPLTSNNMSWTIVEGNPYYSFSSSGMSFRGTADSATYLKLNEALPTGSCSCEVKITGMTPHSALPRKAASIGFKNTFIEAVDNTKIYVSSLDNGTWNQANNKTLNVGDIVRAEYNGTKVKYYINDVYCGEETTTNTGNCPTFFFRGPGGNIGIVVKDLKIKPL